MAEGIFGSVCEWVVGLKKYLPYIDWLIDLCEAVNKSTPGPEKKAIVIDGLEHVLSIFMEDGLLRKAIMFAATWVIDQIVQFKNDSGQFTHGGDA